MTGRSRRRVHARTWDGAHACTTAGTDLTTGDWPDVDCLHCAYLIDEAANLYRVWDRDAADPFDDSIEWRFRNDHGDGVLQVEVPAALVTTFERELAAARVAFCRAYLAEHDQVVP